MTRTWSDSIVPLLHGSAPPIDILTVLTDRHCLLVMGERVTMSGAESEAIVVAESAHEEEGEREGEGVREEVEAVEGEKERQCSGCRTVYTIDQFQGTDKNAGKIMRTCMGCRAKYEKLVSEKICSDCRTQQPLDQFQGSGKRFEGKEMRTCSTCRSRRDYRDVSFMSTRSSEGTKKSLMPEVGYVRDTRRNRLGENRRQMLDKIAKQMVDNGNTFTDKHWKDITESQKLTAWEIPQVKKYIENAMENIEKVGKLLFLSFFFFYFYRDTCCCMCGRRPACCVFG
ncbi:hypothetical protein DFP73DRAFT_537259 [Morchella snyderi]|nr:hypothetical protein DFP73DRAFT_537259 [Morchella snyderi]